MDDDLWAGSGADGLLKRISDHVRYGRQADFDQAELFLARYTVGSDDTGDAPSGRRTSQPHSNTPKRRRSRMTREVVAAMRNEAAEAAEVAQAALEIEQTPREDVAPEVMAEDMPGEQPVTRPLDLDLVIEKPVTRPLRAKQARAVETVPLDDEKADADDDPHFIDAATDETGLGLDVSPAPGTAAPEADQAKVVAASDDSWPDEEAPAPTLRGSRVTSDSLADRLGAMRRVPSKQLLTPDTAAKAGLEEIAKTAKALKRLEDDPEKVLHLCTDTADTLQAVFDNGALPANLVELRDEVLQTCEHMTLLQLENTAGSAADAVTILLQLKRDFEARQAA